MNNKLLAISGALAISTFLSCGDSGDNGSGVDGDALVKDVTGSDVEKVCRWNNDQLLSLVKGVSVRQACTYDIAGASSTRAECREEVDDCVAEAKVAEDEVDDFEDEDPCEDAALPDVAAGCNGITVADYESCVKSLIGATKTVINAASCDDAGEESDDERGAADDLPEQCKTILQRCPSILPGALNPASGDDEDFEEI